MRILASAVAAMMAHARDEAPDECCGLLLGRGNVICEAVRARNALRSPTAYLVHPEDHFAAIRRARQEGTRVAGAYHSHPRSAARPSATDVAEAHDPELLYVIVSLQAGQEGVAAWRIRDGDVSEVELEIVQGGTDQSPASHNP
jgi:[CysO sulfur-carrier protein]-S-L-cysteine hydrolase